MQTQIKMWGNSASIRIPSAVMAAAGLRPDQTVEISEQAGRVVIEPAVRPKYDLAEMVASIRDDQLHELEDWGPPVGNEVW